MVLQTGRDLWAGNAAEWAAAIACYALLSLFPLMLAGAVAASVAVDPAWAAGRASALLAEFVPQGSVEVERIVAAAADDRSRVGAASLAVFLLSGRRVLGALTKALDVVSDVDERADPVRRRALVELALLTGLAAVGTLALAAGPLLDALRGASSAAPGPVGPAYGAARQAVRAALLLAMFYLVYTVVPRGQRDRRSALLGAATATALYVLVHAIFGVAVKRSWVTLDLVYGPLAVAAVLLLWAWYAALVTLVGASLASHAKAMLAEGRGPTETAARHTGRASGPS